MDKKQMDELLAEKISEYGLFIGTPAAKLTASHLATQSAFKQIEITCSSPYRTIWQSAIGCGEILLDSEETGSLDVLIKSGFANMNPAILIVRIAGKNASINAYAKEGLIKQNTAQKAINRLINGLDIKSSAIR